MNNDLDQLEESDPRVESWKGMFETERSNYELLQKECARLRTEVRELRAELKEAYRPSMDPNTATREENEEQFL